MALLVVVVVAAFLVVNRTWRKERKKEHRVHFMLWLA
jgi:hypothetical protein